MGSQRKTPVGITVKYDLAHVHVHVAMTTMPSLSV